MKRLCICLMMALPLAACKKDKKDARQEKIDLIINRPWEHYFRGIDFNNDGSFDRLDPIENTLAECQLDDMFTFKNDDTYRGDPGTNTNGCGAGSFNGTWKLKTNDNELVFDTFNGIILTLNDSIFHFKLVPSEDHIIFIR